MKSINKELVPVGYEIFERYEWGHDPSMPGEPVISGIPSIFDFLVTFDNGDRKKIVDYGFNLEPIPDIFPPYVEDTDTYHKMSKKQVLELFKLILNDKDISNIDVHAINCLKKLIHISDLDNDLHINNLYYMINLKSKNMLTEKLGKDNADYLIELENIVDETEALSRLSYENSNTSENNPDNIIPFKR